MTLAVETQIPGAATAVRPISLADARVSVAQLIRLKIGEEWDAAAPDERARVGRESAPPIPGEVPPPATRDAAIRAALDAYRAGWYVIFVDGEQTAALDAPLAPGPDSLVRFVRLYPA
jgi:hypothetical protein